MASPTTHPPTIRQRVVRELARAISWHRRLLGAALAAGCVAVLIQVLSPSPPASVEVLVAARDLSGGQELSPQDLRTVDVPPEVVPDGAVDALADATEHLLASPLRRGEPVTNVRLVGPDLVESYGTDLVAAPVRVSDAGATTLLRVGSRVDILATPTASTDLDQPARTIARDVPVITVPGAEPVSTGIDGGLIVVAATAKEATALARHQVTARLSLVLRPAQTSD